jgi:hypothetical protein
MAPHAQQYVSQAALAFLHPPWFALLASGGTQQELVVSPPTDLQFIYLPIMCCFVS